MAKYGNSVLECQIEGKKTLANLGLRKSILHPLNHSAFYFILLKIPYKIFLYTKCSKN